MLQLRPLLALLAMAGLLATSLPGVLEARGPTPPVELPGTTSGGPVVVRLYFGSRDELRSLAAGYDIWEVHPELGYAVIMLTPGQYQALQAQGYRMEVDEARTWEVGHPLGLPSYPCYRTVEETYATLQDLATTYSTTAELIHIGASWDKLTPGGPAGYDLYTLRISNESITPLTSKPTFFLLAEVHAREYATAETATRFAEYLLQNYGSNPEIAFLVDYARMYVVPMSNPDGRKKAETGLLWRKNPDSDDGCGNPSYWGVDLNRNSSFKWNTCSSSGCGSNDPCAETYRGPSAASEPETMAIQNAVLGLFPDQRGPNDTDAAPADATGILITLHSYSKLVLWPWGWTSTPAPNSAQLATIGTKLATYNGYTPEQSDTLYPTDGTTDDWAYGTLGIASYTFEMGTTFFQDCATFTNTIWPDNRDALLYAWKIAKTPYMAAYGPDALSAAANPSTVAQGDPIQLTATINDDNNGDQQIRAAEYSVLPLHGGSYPGAPGTGTPMGPADGSWNNKIENVVATVDTSSLIPGDYIVAVRGKDAGENWGPFTAVFLKVGSCEAAHDADFDFAPADPWVFSTVAFTASVTGTAPFDYAWNFGDGSSGQGMTPTHSYRLPGTYTTVLTVTNCCGSEDTPVHTVSVQGYGIFLPLVFKSY